MMNDKTLEKLLSKMYNYKFNDAKKYAKKLKNVIGDDYNFVAALSDTFGNSGWLDGSINVVVYYGIDHFLQKWAGDDYKELYGE